MKPREGVDAVIDVVRAVARYHGYALTVHGTLARDIDLVAVPWTEGAGEPAVLADAVRGALCGWWRAESGDPNDFVNAGNRPQPKPHGRLAWSIYGVLGTYIDLAIMPRVTG